MSQIKIFPISILLAVTAAVSLFLDFYTILPLFILAIGLSLVWIVDFVLSSDSEQCYQSYDSLFNWGAIQSPNSSHSALKSLLRIAGLILVWSGIVLILL